MVLSMSHQAAQVTNIEPSTAALTTGTVVLFAALLLLLVLVTTVTTLALVVQELLADVEELVHDGEICGCEVLLGGIQGSGGHRRPNEMNCQIHTFVGQARAEILLLTFLERRR